MRSILVGLTLILAGCASEAQWSKPGADPQMAQAAVDECQRSAIAAVPDRPVLQPYRDAYDRTIEDRITIAGHDAYPYDVVSPMMTARAANAGRAASASARREFVNRCMTQAGWEQQR